MFPRVRKAGRFVAVVFAFFLLATPSSGARRLAPVKTTDLAAGFLSDWHQGGNPGQGQLGFNIPAWYAAQSPKPSVIFHSGDVFLWYSTTWQDMKNRFAAVGIYDVETCLGNHDMTGSAVDDSLGLGYYPTGESPIGGVVAAALLGNGSHPYWYKNFGPLRVLFLDNMYDTTLVSNGTYMQCYPETNPPGRGLDYWQAHGFANGNPNGTNPEYAGWVTSDSTDGQLAWIKMATAGFGGTFLIALAHRSPYAPYAMGDPLRPPDLGGRSKGWAIVSRAGVDIASTGDEHSCGLTVPMYKGVASANGTTFLETRVGFVRSAAFGTGAGTCQMTEDMVYWPKAADLADANESPSTVFAYVVFHGDRATIQMVQGHSDGSFSIRKTIYIDRRKR